MARKGREVGTTSHTRPSRLATPPSSSSDEEEVYEQVHENASEYDESEDEDYVPSEEEEDVEEELVPEEADNEGQAPLNHPARYGINLLTAEQREAWARLAQLTMYPTRYPCQVATTSLGIHDDVWGLFNRVGWNQAMAGGWLTYPILVYEFLSTLSVQKTPTRGPHTMTFYLGNIPRILTAAEVNNIFHIPARGLYRTFEFQTVDFWTQIQAETSTFDHRYAKASMLPNPVFRYVQKSIASTILARHENSSVRTGEVDFLWAMLSGTNINFAAYLMEQFSRQARQATDAICIGGMITPLAEHFGIRLDRYGSLPGSRSINLSHLRNSRVLASRPDRHFLLLRGDRMFPLPNRLLTTVSDLTDPSNWLMNTPAHVAAIQAVATEGRTFGDTFELQMERRAREREPVPNEESSEQAERRAHMRTRDVRDEDRLDSLSAMMATMNTHIGTLTTNFGVMQEAFQSMRTEVTTIRDDVHDLRDLVRGMQPNPGAYFPGPFYGAGYPGPSTSARPHEPSSSSQSQPQQQPQMPPPFWPYMPYGYPNYRPPPPS